MPNAPFALTALAASALLLAVAAPRAEAQSAASAAPTPPAAAAQSAEPAADPAAAVAHPAKKSKVKAPAVEAKKLFGAQTTSAPLASRAIGFYAKGCLAGAAPLPIDGPVWQAMRLSRNRNWGHPDLIKLIETLAADAKAHDGWSGLLVGDISQPRGGPMLTGHASHQIGLDADIWLTPMPDRRLSETEREELAATSMLAPSGHEVDPKVWTAAHARLIVRAASYPQVERVFVHPAIKKALCNQPDIDRTNLRKVQPYWGHYYHMHIRIHCPPGGEGCTGQPPRPADDGCGKEVEQWLALLKKPPPKPSDQVAKAPAKPKPGLTMEQLPAECRVVLTAKPGATSAEHTGSPKQ